MKTFRKIISVMAAAAIIGTFAVFPVYASNDDTTSPASSQEDEIDESIPIGSDGEDEEDEEIPDDNTPLVIEEDEGDDVRIIPDDDVTSESETAVGPSETSATTASSADTTTTASATTTSATTTAPATATPTYTPVSEFKMYSTGGINVRSGPGTNYNIIGSVSLGKEITVIGKSGDWYAIKIYGTTAYVMAMYFTSTPPVTEQTTAATTKATEATTQATTLASDTALVEDTTTEPAETTAEPEPVVTTTSAEDDNGNTPARTTKPAETTKEADAAAASTTDNNGGGSGIKGLLIAIGCGIGTFLLLGVVPVVAHTIYHKKLYQY